MIAPPALLARVAFFFDQPIPWLPNREIGEWHSDHPISRDASPVDPGDSAASSVAQDPSFPSMQGAARRAKPLLPFRAFDDRGQERILLRGEIDQRRANWASRAADDAQPRLDDAYSVATPPVAYGEVR